MRAPVAAAFAAALIGAVLLTGGCGSGEAPAAPSPSVSASAPSLPKAFPKDKVPLPQDLALTTALTAEVDGGKTFIASFRAPGANPDAVRAYISDLKNDGFKVKEGYDPTVGDQGGVWVLTDNVWELGVAGTVTPESTDVVLTVSREDN